MVTVTTIQLLYDLRQVCSRAPLVSYVEELLVDADILNIRVHLTIANAFINVFYNVTTHKTAFALIMGNQRIFGADNAKMGWHKHPFGEPYRHVSCAPVDFAEFLSEVEAYYA